jgi:hypothetical protein
MVFGLLLLLCYSCSDSGTNPQDQEFVIPESDLTFTDHIGPMVLAKCGSNSGCHNTTDRAGGLDMTNYQSIMLHFVTNEFGSEKLVVPGSGEVSFMYRVLLQNQPGVARMPLDGPFLNSNNTNGIKVWIDEGARFADE